MKKVVLIKYGELSTKKDNINFFLTKLKENVLYALKDLDVTVDYDLGRMFINTNDNHEEVVSRVTKIFGIHEINICYIIDSIDFDDVSKEVLKLLKDKEFKTFKIETKRSNKKINSTSIELSRKMGGVILKNISDIKVDVNNPEILVNIEYRNNNTLVYFEKIKGLGGYPVGTLGKGLLMLSGGIDSPVAGYLACKRGVKLEAIYFESPPHTSIEAKNKVIALARKLTSYNGEINLHIINFTEIQEAIYKNIPHEYLITIMRRMMYRISAIIASNRNSKILINGESIGQVASQTLTSMSAINEVVKIPVIRPLACFDKLDIIDIAKNIDTYETSILPFEDCCTIFVPKHPVINPDKKRCSEYETLIPYEELIYQAIKNHEILKINTKEKHEFEDLL
ncbi:MAG: tRNA 4-thiouridine(8) synthase ThiI [Firmicutes bacterium]|nr:tRNA 4-thiouridine(8) synthase ThiI [Bacillota bacterium]